MARRWYVGRRLVLQFLLGDDQADVVDHTVLADEGLLERNDTALGRSRVLSTFSSDFRNFTNLENNSKLFFFPTFFL